MTPLPPAPAPLLATNAIRRRDGGLRAGMLTRPPHRSDEGMEENRQANEPQPGDPVRSKGWADAPYTASLVRLGVEVATLEMEIFGRRFQVDFPVEKIERR